MGELNNDDELIKRISFEKISGAAYFGEGYQDLYRRKPSVEHIEKIIGWKPQVNLDHALRQTVVWYLENERVAA